jgi:CelD/BcsL family acetyltransferase involved in cellulose biosynthesis
MTQSSLADPSRLSAFAPDGGDTPVGADDLPAPSTGSELTTEWRPLVELDVDVAPWRALAARALEPNIFYEGAFALAAAPVLGAAAGAILVWSVAAPRRLVGLFPLCVERRRYGLSPAVLTGWTHAYAPLGVPLVDRDAADAVIDAFVDHVSREPALPKILLLPLLPLDGPFAVAFRRVLARRGARLATFGRHARAQLAPGDARSDYVERAIGARRRKELRRQRRRLADRGPVRLATASSPAAVAAALTDFFSIETRGWKGWRGTAAAQHPAIRQFIERAITGLAADGMARIDRLMRGERAVAAAIMLHSADTAWFFKIAYDETVAQSSPGVQLALDVTGAMLADATVARVDSCATADHPMIDHLWRERLAIGDLMVAIRPGNDAAFALARRLEHLSRVAIATAKRLRDGWRKGRH